MIPYGRQDITEADIKEVEGVLRSSYITQGPAIEAFEKKVAEHCSVESAVVVNSATSALHLCCLALGVEEGDIVWTSPNSFVASANAARYCGAAVDFVDIDVHTGNICVDVLATKLADSEKTGKLPKLLIVVHFAGQSCDMQAIKKLADRYRFKIIEDAAHAIGGSYQNKPIGSCKYSDATCFSFHPVKIITTGEGGAITSQNSDIIEKVSMLRTHGITRDVNSMHYSPDGRWYYEQHDLGYNYRMTDIQAALGLSQMDRLANYVTIRHALLERYRDTFKNYPLDILRQESYGRPSWHLCVVKLQLEHFKYSKAEICERLYEAGIGVNVHYIPIYLQPYYRNIGFQQGHCPEAEKYYQQALTLPLHPLLTQDEEDFIAAEVKKLLR